MRVIADQSQTPNELLRIDEGSFRLLRSDSYDGLVLFPHHVLASDGVRVVLPKGAALMTTTELAAFLHPTGMKPGVRRASQVGGWPQQRLSHRNSKPTWGLQRFVHPIELGDRTNPSLLRREKLEALCCTTRAWPRRHCGGHNGTCSRLARPLRPSQCGPATKTESLN